MTVPLIHDCPSQSSTSPNDVHCPAVRKDTLHNCAVFQFPFNKVSLYLKNPAVRH